MKVYSPSSTKVWERCPTLREFERAGWHSTTFDYGDLTMMAGDAFALGMETYNKDRSGKTTLSDCLTVAHERLEQRIGEPVKAGGQWDERAKAAMEPYAQGIQDALTFAITNDPTPPEWIIIYAENSLGEEAGHARPDVVYKLPDGALYVRDYKFKLTLDKKYEAERVREYLDSGQAYHYLWFAYARFFNALIVVATPKPHFVGLAGVREWDDAAMVRWHDSQQAKWRVMKLQEQDVLPLWMSETHEDRFGQCAAYDACFAYEQDRERMLAGGYIQIEREVR